MDPLCGARLQVIRTLNTKILFCVKNAEALQILYDFCEKHNMRYIKSNANFTFFETGMDSKEVNARILKHGILIGRPFPPKLDWMRISTARPEDMQFFVEAYEKEFFS